MDLREARPDHTQRHPWEAARAAALRRILSSVPVGPHSHVLDVGCGDGFTATTVFEGIALQRLVGVDANFTDDQIRELGSQYPDAQFFRDTDQIPNHPYDLILLLDVLEHVEDDLQFLAKVVDERLCETGYLLITVPAFGRVFSGHDAYLKHYRRYDPGRLEGVVSRAGLRSISTGYLFSSLLPIRMLSAGLERILPTRSEKPHGVGQWQHGPVVTRLMDRALQLDNGLLWSLGKAGLNVPGLTEWMLTRKP